MSYIYSIIQNVFNLLSEPVVGNVSVLWFFIALFSIAVVLRFI